MGSLTIQVIGDGTVGTKTKTVTVPDADINRLVAYGKSMVGGTPTVTEGLLAYCSQVWARTQSDVLGYEASQATKVIAPIAGS